MYRKSSWTSGHVLAAAIVGAIAGAAAVAAATNAIPRVISRAMAGMMRNMMARMREEGVDPAEMCRRMMGLAEAQDDATGGTGADQA